MARFPTCFDFFWKPSAFNIDPGNEVEVRRRKAQVFVIWLLGDLAHSGSELSARSRSRFCAMSDSLSVTDVLVAWRSSSVTFVSVRKRERGREKVKKLAMQSFRQERRLVDLDTRTKCAAHERPLDQHAFKEGEGESECVCVCVREREREREDWRCSPFEPTSLIVTFVSVRKRERERKKRKKIGEAVLSRRRKACRSRYSCKVCSPRTTVTDQHAFKEGESFHLYEVSDLKGVCRGKLSKRQIHLRSTIAPDESNGEEVTASSESNGGEVEDDGVVEVVIHLKDGEGCGPLQGCGRLQGERGPLQGCGPL